MTMVTLSDIVAPDKNLHGIIPRSATCFPRASGDILRILRLSAVAPEETKAEGLAKLRELEEKYGGGVSLDDFIRQEPKWARQYEWSLNCNGCLVHWMGPVLPIGESKYRTVNIIELDVSAFLKTLDDLSLLRLAAHAFDCWRDGDTDPRDLFTEELVAHVVEGRHEGYSERGHFLNNRRRDRERETRLYDTLGRVHPDPKRPSSPLAVLPVRIDQRRGC